MTYGGDDVSAIVLEVGSHWTKAGYAGEDCPKAAFPTSYGVIEGGTDAHGDVMMDGAAQKRFMAESAFLFRENMAIRHPLNSNTALGESRYCYAID